MLLTLLLACLDAAPDAPQRPPPTVALDPLQRATASNAVLTGLVPNAPVYVGASASTGVGPCPPALGGCLDLAPPVSLLGTAVADGAGRATVRLIVPPELPDDAWLQVAQPGALVAPVAVAVGDVSPWRPPPDVSWQWQLQGAIDTAVDADVFDVDLFDAPQQVIDDLHAQGRSVICYLSAGSWEDWRPDAAAFPPAVRGRPLDGWPGERWLDVRAPAVRAALADRLDLAVARGCDAVEPDNVDGHQNDTGFALTKADVLSFNRFLVAEAHARGLSIGLKNALDLVTELQPEYDWALNEECLAFNECTLLKPFIDAGKAVFHVEYVDQQSDGPAKKTSVCGQPSIAGFSTLIKTWDLDVYRLSCD